MSNAAILLNRLMPGRASSRYGKQVLWLLASLHLAALIILLATESDPVAKAAFLLVWIVLNCFWLAFVRRPTIAALISLELVIALMLLSRFKYDKLWMTLDFVDVMIVDQDTSAFLLAAFPSLRGWIALAAAATAALLILIWRLDQYRVCVSSSLLGGSLAMIPMICTATTFTIVIDGKIIA